MKISRLFLLSAAIAGMLSFSLGNVEAASSSGYKTVTHGGMSVEVPKKWKKVDSDKVGSASGVAYGILKNEKVIGVILGKGNQKTEKNEDQFDELWDNLTDEFEEMSYAVGYEIEYFEDGDNLYFVLYFADWDSYDELEDAMDHGLDSIILK